MLISLAFLFLSFRGIWDFLLRISWVLRGCKTHFTREGWNWESPHQPVWEISAQHQLQAGLWPGTWCGSAIRAPGSVACPAPWLSLSPITNVGWFFCGSGSWQRPLALENLCCLPTRVSIQEYMGFLPANKLSRANTLQDARWLLEKRGSERCIIVSWPGRCREALK